MERMILLVTANESFAIVNVAMMIVTGWCSCVLNAIVIMLAKVDGYG